MSTSPTLVAVGQMTSTSDVEKNAALCADLASRAKSAGAALLCLPECFAFMGAADGDTQKIMEPLAGPLFAKYRAIAKDAGLWVSFGGFPERGDDGVHNHNAHVVVDDQGVVRAVYRKVHLFDVTLANGSVYKESASTAAGNERVVVESPVGRLGLSVCYDLRFPELYRALANPDAIGGLKSGGVVATAGQAAGAAPAGAHVLLVPAAFTLTTGKEHWEALLRARAIENQCYVVAAAQTGRHNEKRDTFGHAMIVDPWGTVVAQCRDGHGIAVGVVDLGWLEEVRRRIPVWQHRRPDVY